MLNTMTAAEVPRSTSANWMFRINAALIHLAASGVLALIVAAMVFALWFPGDYRSMSGGTELFVLVVGVDIAMGPLITLVIFDKRKSRKHLLCDITVIATLQLAALVYGLHTVSISRPVVLALEEDRFRVVAAMDVYLPELASASSEFQSLSLTGPRLLRSLVPSDPKGRSDALELGLKGFDVGNRPSLWRPWDAAARKEALAHAKPLSTIAVRYKDHPEEVNAAIAKTGRSAEALVYIPMITFRDDWIALLDPANGDVIGFAPVDGF